LKDIVVDGMIIVNGSSVQCGGMDWIDLAQDRDKLRALVNAVMNLRVLLNAVNLWTS
jgi:hypothetical protein